MLFLRPAMPFEKWRGAIPERKPQIKRTFTRTIFEIKSWMAHLLYTAAMNYNNKSEHYFRTKCTEDKYKFKTSQNTIYTGLASVKQWLVVLLFAPCFVSYFLCSIWSKQFCEINNNKVNRKKKHTDWCLMNARRLLLDSRSRYNRPLRPTSNLLSHSWPFTRSSLPQSGRHPRMRYDCGWSAWKDHLLIHKCSVIWCYFFCSSFSAFFFWFLLVLAENKITLRCAVAFTFMLTHGAITIIICRPSMK